MPANTQTNTAHSFFNAEGILSTNTNGNIEICHVTLSKQCVCVLCILLFLSTLCCTCVMSLETIVKPPIKASQYLFGNNVLRSTDTVLITLITFYLFYCDKYILYIYMCVSLPLCIRLTDSFNGNLLILKIGLIFICTSCFAMAELLCKHTQNPEKMF